jgi:flagellar FliJ protein
MKKFEFSLSKMMDYKKQLLENEKNKMSKLIMDRDSYQNRIDVIQIDYEQIHMKMSEEISKGVTIMEIKMYQYRKDSIKREQNQLYTQISFLEGAIERQRRVVVELSQEISGLEKLEEKQRTEYNRLVAKEDELLISEFIASKFVSQQISSAK